MTAITIRDADYLATRIAPLYCKYRSQSTPQPAFISIDTETAEVSADYNSEIGNAVPACVYHGIEIRLTVNPYAKGAVLASFLRSEEFTALAQRIVDGASVEWDGSNHVARQTDDSLAAEEELAALIANEFHPAEVEQLSEVWDADYLLSFAGLGDYWKPSQTLDEAVADLTQSAREQSAMLEIDPREFLLDEAQCNFNSRFVSSGGHSLRGELSELQVAALQDACRITTEDAAEWHEEFGK